jgi:hypothetical protein
VRCLDSDMGLLRLAAALLQQPGNHPATPPRANVLCPIFPPARPPSQQARSSTGHPSRPFRGDKSPLQAHTNKFYARYGPRTAGHTPSRYPSLRVPCRRSSHRTV